VFGYAAFAELPFATIGAAIEPPPQEVLLGGHFGFDERDKDTKRVREEEKKRRVKIKTALFGLPPEERELITSAPEQTIMLAAQTEINYDRVMQEIAQISARIEFERDEQDIEDLLEFL